MNITSLSSLVETASVSNVARNQQTQRLQSSGMPQDGPPEMSAIANYMQQLEQLQESDPDKFKEVSGKIAAQLKEAAASATESGDAKQAEALTDLASKFETAATDGTMPDLAPPEGAGSAGGPRPGPPPGPPPGKPPDGVSGSSSESSSTSSSSSASDSAGADAATSSDSVEDALLKALSAYLQQVESNPMSTLAGIFDSVLGSGASSSSASSSGVTATA